MTGTPKGKDPIRVELHPDPDHCLETQARRAYQELAAAYLRGGAEEEAVGERIDMLREFLARADFRRLRQECERRLQRGDPTGFVLLRNSESLQWGFLDELEDED